MLKIESTVGLCFCHFIVLMANNTSRSQSLINDSELQFIPNFDFFEKIF
jgi:20S proteasome alpha/beta subunit